MLTKKKETVSTEAMGESLTEPQRELEVLMAQSSPQTTKPHSFPFRSFRAGLERKVLPPLRAEW